MKSITFVFCLTVIYLSLMYAASRPEIMNDIVAIPRWMMFVGYGVFAALGGFIAKEL